ncbi:MAG: SDR family oxidoreductase [Phycisphaerae bacterium]|nr:SDR family oxidoreductase [Phycisphaerae bacterium]MDW8261797.1 SDR family oxidoreductase [Phycisphaerales bacterium]
MSRPIAIITGSGRGIGRATALELARTRGYGVVVTGRTRVEVEQTAAEAGEALAIVADVSSAAGCATVIERALAWRGRIDALVNNAGYAPVLSLEQTTDAELDRVIQTNFSAAFRLSRACWPLFREQRHGVIVHVSSAAARDPLEGFHAYGAAKAALNTLTISMAREGAAHGIRVHAVAPGATETRMFRAIADERAWPRDKTLAPDDVAKVIAACVCGDLKYTSGEVIYVQRIVS